MTYKNEKMYIRHSLSLTCQAAVTGESGIIPAREVGTEGACISGLRCRRWAAAQSAEALVLSSG